ncbi:MAG: hypothetical protein CMM93_08590 [Rickettsiales bacterium]|nr:hypothetical protein [Rickettsiales bacterium]
MKFYPILFNSPNVRAILANRKTQTRRVKGLKKINQDPERYMIWGVKDNGYSSVDDLDDLSESEIKAPYGLPGDVLWVREAFHLDKNNEPFYRKQETHHTVTYRADHFHRDIRLPKTPNNEDLCEEGWFDPEYPEKPIWKPSIHMPKTACRIFLKVNSVRIERLTEISEGDSSKEGIKMRVGITKPQESFYQKPNCPNRYATAKQAFKSLWISIHKKDSWEHNPWVWVYNFERIEKPKNFI